MISQFSPIIEKKTILQLFDFHSLKR